MGKFPNYPVKMFGGCPLPEGYRKICGLLSCLWRRNLEKSNKVGLTWLATDGASVHSWRSGRRPCKAAATPASPCSPAKVLNFFVFLKESCLCTGPAVAPIIPGIVAHLRIFSERGSLFKAPGLHTSSRGRCLL